MPTPLNWTVLNAQIADVGTAGVVYFSAPADGYLRGVTTTLFAPITGANDVITVAVNGSNLSPTITVTQSGSAAGDIDSAEFYVPVKKGARVTCSNSGASTGTAPLAYSVYFSE